MEDRDKDKIQKERMRGVESKLIVTNRLGQEEGKGEELKLT